MIRPILTLAMVLTCLAASGMTHGQSREMYSWTDENGIVHFTDQRPMGQEVKVHEIPDSAPPATDNPYAVPEEESDVLSPADQTRDEMAQRREETQEVRATRDAECAAMQAEVDRLEPHRRVFFTNEQGETERMDDVVRVDRVAKAKAFIEQNCR